MVYNHIHPPTTRTSFFPLCPLFCKVIFKLLGSKPGVITDGVPRGARVHTHTHTPLLYPFRQSYVGFLPTPPSYCLYPVALHCHLSNSGPPHPPSCPQPPVWGSQGSLYPPGKLPKDKSRHCPLQYMEARDNDHRQ